MLSIGVIQTGNPLAPYAISVISQEKHKTYVFGMPDGFHKYMNSSGVKISSVKAIFVDDSSVLELGGIQTFAVTRGRFGISKPLDVVASDVEEVKNHIQPPSIQLYRYPIHLNFGTLPYRDNYLNVSEFYLGGIKLGYKVRDRSDDEYKSFQQLSDQHLQQNSPKILPPAFRGELSITIPKTSKIIPTQVSSTIDINKHEGFESSNCFESSLDSIFENGPILEEDFSCNEDCYFKHDLTIHPDNIDEPETVLTKDSLKDIWSLATNIIILKPNTGELEKAAEVLSTTSESLIDVSYNVMNLIVMDSKLMRIKGTHDWVRKVLGHGEKIRILIIDSCRILYSLSFNRYGLMTTIINNIYDIRGIWDGSLYSAFNCYSLYTELNRNFSASELDKITLIQSKGLVSPDYHDKQLTACYNTKKYAKAMKYFLLNVIKRKDLYDSKELRRKIRGILKSNNNELVEYRSVLVDDPKFPHIVLLGTGATSAIESKGNSSYLVRISEELSILVDCGEGTTSQIVRKYGLFHDVVFRSIKMVLLTHEHIDHIHGLLNFCTYWLKCQKEPPGKDQKLDILYMGQSAINNYYEIFPSSLKENINLANCYKMSSSENDEEWWDITRPSLQFVRIIAFKMTHIPKASGYIITIYRDNEKKTIDNIYAFTGDGRPSSSLPLAVYNICKECKDININNADTKKKTRVTPFDTIIIHDSTFDDSLQYDAMWKKHSTVSEAITVTYSCMMAMKKALDADFKDYNHRFGLVLSHTAQRYEYSGPNVPKILSAKVTKQVFSDWLKEQNNENRKPYNWEKPLKRNIDISYFLNIISGCDLMVVSGENMKELSEKRELIKDLYRDLNSPDD